MKPGNCQSPWESKLVSADTGRLGRKRLYSCPSVLFELFSGDRVACEEKPVQNGDVASDVAPCGRLVSDVERAKIHRFSPPSHVGSRPQHPPTSPRNPDVALSLCPSWAFYILLGRIIQAECASKTHRDSALCVSLALSVHCVHSLPLTDAQESHSDLLKG